MNHLMISIRKAVLVTVAFLGVSALTGFAQQKISGTVVDVTGQPVIGASVMVPGTTTGAVTDLDGRYELSVAAGTDLVVSCIGYVDQTFKVSASQAVYNFTLSEDSEMLEETVVIGYGTVKVKDLTGSVASVGSKELEAPVANVAEALQGKMAGVVVTMNDGAPGATPQIRVRGNKSITQTNDPLYIVDGFPVSNLSNVPADQIKSINVLKDAAATAIYGSRGAAGVVLVTTKNAIEGQTSVSYNGYVQIKDSSMNVRDVMQPLDYLKFTLGYARDYSAVNYDGMLRYFGMSDVMGNSTYGNNYSKYAKAASHNWQSDLYKTALSHSHNVTVSNGTKRGRTLFSLNFINDDGTVVNSFYQRVNASLKTIEKLSDNFDIELNASYSYSKSRGGSRVAGAFRYHPIDEVYGDPTYLAGFGNGSSYIDDSYNPLDLTYNTENTSYNHNFRAIGALNWTVIDGLKLRSELGLNKGFGKDENYNGGFGNETNSASLNRSESANMHWTTTASYEIPFKSDIHRADIMVGNEYIRSSSSSMYFYGYKYPSNFDRETTFAMLSQFTDNYTFKTDIGVPGRSVSFFTRANYSLMDKYLFTFTMRADGSSKFAVNNRWGYFPAGAFAWRVIDEPWMASTKDWLSNLKLRLSYGVTGSDAINANLWRETWSLGGDTSYTISDHRSGTENDYSKPYAPGTMMMNNDLKWESTITRNLGIDFGFLKERVYGSFETYWSTTNDLLMPVAVNAASGYSYQYQNMGVVSNKGIELSLGGDIVRTSDFSLSANFIYNYNYNCVEKLAPSVMVNTYGQWANSEHRPNDGEYFLQEGKPIGVIRGYRNLGWYTLDDFIYDPSNGMYTLKEGIPDFAEDSYWTSFNLPAGQKAFPGALKFDDIDNDGKIDTKDTYEIGEMTPRSTGSFSFSARWKNVDLSANFNYVIGGKLMNMQSLYSLYGSKDNNFGANRLSFVSEAYSPYRWTSNGELEFVSDPGELKKMNAGATMHTPTSMVGFLLDNYVESASYLRLKNLTIGYTVPKSISRKVGINNLRAYFTATNLFTLTGYTGLNPEVNTNRSSNYGFPTPGVDNNAYPMAKTYTFGLNITL